MLAKFANFLAKEFTMSLFEYSFVCSFKISEFTRISISLSCKLSQRLLI
jgi:hypothetical protein